MSESHKNTKRGQEKFQERAVEMLKARPYLTYSYEEHQQLSSPYPWGSLVGPNPGTNVVIISELPGSALGWDVVWENVGVW